MGEGGSYIGGIGASAVDMNGFVSSRAVSMRPVTAPPFTNSSICWSCISSLSQN